MNKKLITFLYHEATDNPSSSGFQRQGAMPYKHKVQHFLDDLDAIQSVFSYSIIVDDHKKYDGNSLILTFDDGGKSALTIADILDYRALIGHFFVTTSMIGTPGFLSEDEIQELDRRGHIIGSHSHSHPSIFRDISFQQKLEEWQVSKQILENILCKDVVSASIPGGDMDDETIETAAKAGIPNEPQQFF
jgi:peptidoglycan/xylan/chitin deacetylase (PgdA/CDA1 family)